MKRPACRHGRGDDERAAVRDARALSELSPAPGDRRDAFSTPVGRTFPEF